jgi:hypothetical protein
MSQVSARKKQWEETTRLSKTKPVWGGVRTQLGVHGLFVDEISFPIIFIDMGTGVSGAGFVCDV